MHGRSFLVDYPLLRPRMWFRNSHLQTIAPVILKGQNSTRIPVKRLVTLSDGDRMVVQDDQAKSWITGDRIAILVHGLCGSHNSPYVRRIAMRLRRHGIRTVRIDMRGFGDSTLISRGQIHAGLSNDIRDVVEFCNRLSPLSKISLIGFSLGANTVLKYLIEQSQLDQPQENVDSAIAVAPPIDLEVCSAHLRFFGNRFYDYYFVKRLTRALIHRRRHVADLVDNGMNPLPDRLVQFDDEFTAPVNGFAGARDYYQRCSTVNDMDKIRTPTILVAAEDDPIVPFEIFDTRYFSPKIELVHTRDGGHLGFMGTNPRDPDQHWLDWRICSWIDSLDN